MSLERFSLTWHGVFAGKRVYCIRKYINVVLDTMVDHVARCRLFYHDRALLSSDELAIGMRFCN